jgi:hypothetical protein
MRRLFLAIPLAAGIMTGCGSDVPTAKLIPPATRKEAPDFTLKTIDGRDFSLASLRGKPVLLNFWAVG